MSNVKSPEHYAWLHDEIGIEPIDVCELMNFNRGNALKYILRAGRKYEAGMGDRQKEIEDLEKARYYIDREINRLEGERNLAEVNSNVTTTEDKQYESIGW